MSKFIFREIQLLPTDFILDVVVTPNEKEAYLFLKDRYKDLPGEFIFNDQEQILNTVGLVFLPINESICEPRILLVLESIKDKSIIAHELIHVLWSLSDLVGTEMHISSQEWQAQMMSFLFNRIIDIPGEYKKENLKKSA